MVTIKDGLYYFHILNIYNVNISFNKFIEKKSSTEWILTIRRCTAKDGGCYVVKAINNIGSDEKSWKMLVVTAKPNNMLVPSCKDYPEGNQFGPINKNQVQSDDINSLSKLVEVGYIFSCLGTRLKKCKCGLTHYLFHIISFDLNLAQFSLTIILSI